MREDDPHREAASLRGRHPGGGIGQALARAAAERRAIGWRSSASAASRSRRASCSSTTRASHESARHAGSQRLQRGHLSHPRGGGLGGDVDRQRQGRRAADHQALRGLPACAACRSRRSSTRWTATAVRRSRWSDEIEQVLGIPCCPLNWPVGSGPGFQGVYDRERREVLRFERNRVGEREASLTRCAPRRREPASGHGRACTRRAPRRARAAGTAGNALRLRSVPRRPGLTGLLRQRHDELRRRAVPRPFRRVRAAAAPAPELAGPIAPTLPRFSGFVFKIQANMDPNHRDRIAFLRVCSGRFTKGMDVSATFARVARSR